MKKAFVFLFVALFGAQPVYAGARDECADTGGKWVNKECSCPSDGEHKLVGTKCVKQKSCDVPAGTPAPTPTATASSTRKRTPKAPVAPTALTCRLNKSGLITPASADTPVSLTITCDPGNSPITALTAECQKGCVGDDGAKTMNHSPTPTKPPSRVVKEFTVKRDPQAVSNDPATVVLTGQDKNGLSDSASVTIKWPAPEKSADQKICEDVDRGVWDAKNQVCICQSPKIAKGWVDDLGKVHFCKEPEKVVPPPAPAPTPGPGPKGEPGETKIVHEGSGAAFVARLAGTMLKDGPEPITGLGIMAGGSFGFLNDRLRLEFMGGLMYSPTAEYDSAGHQVRDASGNIKKNSMGFLADGTVSILPIRQLALGLGVGYWRFGQHWSGPEAKGTIEAAGGIGRIAYYPVIGRHVSLELSLTPMLGAMWGGRSDSSRATGGLTLGVGARFW